MRISTDVLRIHGLLEKRVYKAYFDLGGVLTIGEGHTTNVREGQVATDAEIDAWNRQDFMLCEAAIKRLVTRNLTQGQWDALCLFINNVGVHAFETSTLLRKLNEGNAVAASRELRRWNHVGSAEVRGLTKRRLIEVLIWYGRASMIDAVLIALLEQYV